MGDHRLELLHLVGVNAVLDQTVGGVADIMRKNYFNSCIYKSSSIKYKAL
jgi:hypothetical protein